MEPDEKLIKISEMANLHGISRQTLILYDKNGLLKPVYVSDTGYRYYSISQVPRLREIVFLKEIGVPLSSIRTYMENRSATAQVELLDARQDEIERAMDVLSRQLSYLTQRKQLLAHVGTLKRNLNQPHFEWLPAREAAFSPYPSCEMDPYKLHLTLLRANQHLMDHGMLPSAGFGSLLRLAAVETERPLDGAGSIVMLPYSDGQEDEHVVMIPEGEYAVMYKYAMPYNTGPVRELLAWVREQGMEPESDVIDLCLLDANFHDSEHPEDFCRLEIRVRPSA